MAGPNSAPNGDGRLVKGSKHQEFVYNNSGSRNCSENTCPGGDDHRACYVPLRDHLAQSGKLVTGKTK